MAPKKNEVYLDKCTECSDSWKSNKTFSLESMCYVFFLKFLFKLKTASRFHWKQTQKSQIKIKLRKYLEINFMYCWQKLIVDIHLAGLKMNDIAFKKYEVLTAVLETSDSIRQKQENKHKEICPRARRKGAFGQFLCGSAGKESASNVGDLGSIPGLGRSPGEWPGGFHGQCSPWGRKQLDMIKQLSLSP